MAETHVYYKLDPSGNFVQLFSKGEHYGEGTYIQWSDNEIYQVIRCPDIWLGPIKDSCYWYWGNDYELFDALNTDTYYGNNLPHIGYKVNGVLMYDFTFLMARDGKITKGTYFFYDGKVYRATKDFEDIGSVGESVVELGFKYESIYVFSPNAFSTFEKGMYIYYPDYTHVLENQGTQVFYSIFRVLENMTSPAVFEKNAKLEAVGVSIYTWKDCKRLWQLALFLSEYPDCFIPTVGNLVYAETSHGYSQMTQSVYEVMVDYSHRLILQTMELSVGIRWVHIYNSRYIEHYGEGTYIQWSDNEIYQVIRCNPKYYTRIETDKCFWSYGRNNYFYQGIDGKLVKIGYLMGGYLLHDSVNTVDEGDLVYKDDNIYLFGKLRSLYTVTIPTTENQVICAQINGGALIYNSTFKAFEGTLINFYLVAEDGYTVGTLNIDGVIVVQEDIDIVVTDAELLGV